MRYDGHEQPAATQFILINTINSNIINVTSTELQDGLILFFFKIVIHLHKCRGHRGVLLVQHHMRMVTQVEGFRTLCSLLPASSSCRSLAFNSSLVLCLICSWRSADSCSFSSFIAEILDFSSRTTRSVSYRNKKQKYTKFKFKNVDKGALE